MKNDEILKAIDNRPDKFRTKEYEGAIEILEASYGRKPYRYLDDYEKQYKQTFREMQGRAKVILKEVAIEEYNRIEDVRKEDNKHQKMVEGWLKDEGSK